MNLFDLLFSRKPSAVVITICPEQHKELERANEDIKQHLSKKNEQLNNVITKKLAGQQKAYK